MNKLYFYIVLLFIPRDGICDQFQETLGHIKTKTNADIQKQAVTELIQRTISLRASDFVVNVDPELILDGKEAFKVYKENGKIYITGTTGVVAATGFNHYLKYYCYAHISWEASQLNLPEILPDVNITITLNDRFRYYQNTCTTSYSFVWWDWPQWENHIDWIALNSFNLVLAFNGQEAIWDKVYKNLNLTQEEIDEHFTGPAFLSWLRMGNLRGWGGPLSISWHERSIWLQKKILKRMRSLGIIPILPAFAGHLPRAIKRVFPTANVTLMHKWCDFEDSYCCPYFLDPTDDLFNFIGKMFIEEQTKEFGTDHIYNCDSFNEMDPSTPDLKYLSNVGKSIFAAMTAADSKAVWLMQGWLFYNSGFWSLERAKALLTSVPLGKIIILDLQSEEFPQYDRLKQYFGQPYIWCMLHDFGGTLGMFGSANIVNKNVIEARNQENSTMIGIGLTMEGINQNYVVYDLMVENAWRKKPTNLTEWFRNYAIRRYGKVNEDIIRAWQILQGSVYNFAGNELMRGVYAITWSPTIYLNIWSWYNYTDVFDVWDIFVNSADDLKDSPAFQHDLIDLTRQILQIYGDVYYTYFVNAFNSSDYNTFNVAALAFNSIFDDLELILATNKAFMLGPWIAAARQCTNDSQEKDLFEFNARNQISLWGPNGEIINYANKQWSGVVSNYYKPRWNEFIDYMNVSISLGLPFLEDLVSVIVFNSAEKPFTFDRTPLPTEPSGDTIAVAKKIHKRWSAKLHKDFLLGQPEVLKS